MAKGKYEEWLLPEKLADIEGWAMDGLSEEQIAVEKMHVAYSTFREWKKRYSAFSAALKRGRETADHEVQNALFMNACGYWTEETTTEKMLSESGIMVVAREKTVRKFVQPNPTAQIFWLKNRMPDRWKDKREEKQETTDNQITIRFESDIDQYAD